MTFQKGNKAAVGNKGGGRPSAYQERENADLLWDMFYGNLSEKEIEKKIKSGKFSLNDRFLQKALAGNERVMTEVFKKLFPERYEHDFKKPVNITVTRGDGTENPGSLPGTNDPLAQEDN